MAEINLIAIKKRIKSVTSTRKITKAMGVVATSKLGKIKTELQANERFHNSFNEVMRDVLDNYPLDKYNIFTNGNDSKKKLYIVLTSDSGLCGGFNSSVVNVTVDEIEKDRENSIIILVGSRGKPYFLKHNFEFESEFMNLPDIPNKKDTNLIADKIIQMYVDKKVGEVYIINTKFISTMNQKVSINKILPLDYKSNDEFKKYIEFEPEVDRILKKTIHMYLNQEVLNFMLNSKASEQSSRMIAMNGATKNANEILDNLHLQYNRIRQKVITQEISEIVGGAEAQK